MTKQETNVAVIIRDVSIASMTVPYQAVMKGDWESLKSFLEGDRAAVVYPLTVNKDTALHIGIYSGSMELVENIIGIAREVAAHAQHPPAEPTGGLVQSPFLIQNEYGNTALHEAAARGNVQAAEWLLDYDRRPLEIKNRLGETPLYRAAAFGMTKMVEFLAGEVTKEREHNPFLSIHRSRDDSNSILHIAVHGGHFETALWLQNKDETLGQLKDQEGRTCLHLLANMPAAYKSGQPMGKLKQLFYNCLPSDNIVDGDHEAQIFSSQRINLRGERDAYRLFCSSYLSACKAISRMNYTIWQCLAQGWPGIDGIWKEKRRQESLLKLTKLLVKKDISWELSYAVPDKGVVSFGERGRSEGTGQIMREGPYGGAESKIEIPLEKKIAQPYTPLLIASSTGIIEIVEEILRVYPQAVDHVSRMGQNILHVAIKHRRREIFRCVKKMKIPMVILVRKIDNNSQTILHHAAGIHNYYGSYKPSPVLQLRDELHWFERVKKITPPHYIVHHDNKDQTAEILFEETHSKLHQDAQTWLKRTSESCSVIAVLISTVAFTAIYTVPGGTNDETGLPVLLHYPFFFVFTVFDLASLTSSLASLVMFLSIHTSPFQLQDFSISLPRKLSFGFTFLFISVSATMLAFAATMVLEIRLKARWSMSLIYTVAFLPVTMFALLQFPLYVAFTGTMRGSFKVFRKAFPLNYVPHLFNTTISAIQKVCWSDGSRSFHRFPQQNICKIGSLVPIQLKAYPHWTRPLMSVESKSGIIHQWHLQDKNKLEIGVNRPDFELSASSEEETLSLQLQHKAVHPLC